MSEQKSMDQAEKMARMMVHTSAGAIGIGTIDGSVGTMIRCVESADSEDAKEKWIRYIAGAIRIGVPAAQPDQTVAKDLPCGRCGRPVVEFVLPNWVWNAVVRRGQIEGGQEYLCEACFRRAVVVYVGAAQATIQALSDALAATRASPLIDGDVS